MKEKIIKNKHFTASQPDKAKDKFNGGSALSFAWRVGQEPYSLLIDSCTIDGSGVAEGLKLSFCNDVTVKNCEIIGGYEDCVDMVRGRNISFENCVFISQGTKQHITAKGGIKNLSFKNCIFENDFKYFFDGACIDLGNWTDYDDIDRPMNRNISIEACKMKNISNKILYRRLYSETPEVINSDGIGFRVPRIFVGLFWLGQRKEWLGKRRRFPKEWLKIHDCEL